MSDLAERRDRESGIRAVDEADRQDIRLAVVMNGGVSLAIWISGVTLELFRVATARRGAGSPYRPLLDLLCATARVDVIAGTSAGGLNGAFLALGLARDRDLSAMRDLWREHGSLDKLLRDPLARNPKSLLRGDDYFLVKVREALDAVAHGASVSTDGPAEPLPVELVLTGTLWQGRSSLFADDMGAGITEVDHDATFQFTNAASAGSDRAAGGDLSAENVLGELAAAARCTSSFPGAFEPHFVQVRDADPGGDLRWASTAGRANFREDQYVVDGGVLLNKPIRPALEAVYRQTAGFQVRRILAYVVPDPGERPAAPPGGIVRRDAAAARPAVPGAREVLLGVLTRLRSTDSVSRELAEIRDRNTEVRTRRRARTLFATAMTAVADPLSIQAWPAYREARAENAARTIAPLLTAGQRGQSTDRWSEQEMLAQLRTMRMSFVPAEPLSEALDRADEEWDWGQTTVQRLADMVVDLLKRAVWLAELGSDERTAVVACRQAIRDTLGDIHADRRTLNAYWSGAPTGLPEFGIEAIPARRGSTGESADNLAELGAWLRKTLDGWDRVRTRDGVPRRVCLFRQVVGLAGRLGATASAIRAITAKGNSVLDPQGEQARQLAALHEFLLPARPAAAAATEARSVGGDDTVPAEVVLRNMLRLDVVQLAFTSASREPEQEVELVQVSSLEPERLTGIQLHHFGAFYRGSWRVNDWLQGRIDGVAQLVRTLLSPERLRQCLLPATSAGARAEQDAAARLLTEIEQLAVPDQSPDRAWLSEKWAGDRAACQEEVRRTVTGTSNRSLDACARAIARPIQLEVLREDLSYLAEAVRAEGDDRALTSTRWLESFDAAVRTSADPREKASLPAEKLWDLWTYARAVGGERIEGELGSDTFARTVTHTTAVAANTAGADARIKPLAAVLSAFRGYTLTVWAMVALLTRKSRIGTRAVEIAVAAGGVLLAVTLLVPAVPVALTLVGVVLLLAAFTSAALLTPDARPVGVRLAAATIVVVLALAGYLWWDWSRSGSAALIWNIASKLGVALLIVLLGWWIARAHPRQRRQRRPT